MGTSWRRWSGCSHSSVRGSNRRVVGLPGEEEERRVQRNFHVLGFWIHCRKDDAILQVT